MGIDTRPKDFSFTAIIVFTYKRLLVRTATAATSTTTTTSTTTATYYNYHTTQPLTTIITPSATYYNYHCYSHHRYYHHHYFNLPPLNHYTLQYIRKQLLLKLFRKRTKTTKNYFTRVKSTNLVRGKNNGRIYRGDNCVEN